jgi:hypothetical protein
MDKKRLRTRTLSALWLFVTRARSTVCAQTSQKLNGKGQDNATETFLEVAMIAWEKVQWMTY